MFLTQSLRTLSLCRICRWLCLIDYDIYLLLLLLLVIVTIATWGRFFFYYTTLVDIGTGGKLILKPFQLPWRNDHRLEALFTIILYLEIHYVMIFRLSHPGFLVHRLLALYSWIEWHSFVWLLAHLINCEESIYLGITRHGLVKQGECLENWALVNKWSHVDLNSSGDLFVPHRSVN